MSYHQIRAARVNVGMIKFNMVTVCTDQFNRLHGAARGILLAKILFPSRSVILLGMDLMKAALRALSEGRFVGIICAKSVAESVFGSQILKTFRDQGIDIDATAESLHRQLAPQQGIPNRTDKPIEFMHL